MFSWFHQKEKNDDKPKAPLIRVIETNDKLSGLSESDFSFDRARASLALAFISPHVDFYQVTSELRRMAGSTPIVAVSTSGELCSCGGEEPLYKSIGATWSSVVLQIFPADLFEAVSVHSVGLFNEDIRQGAPSMDRDVRIGKISRALKSLEIPFAIDVHDTVALTFIDGLSSCENYFMEAVYHCGKFPCLFIGGSAGGRFDFQNTFIFDGRRILENHAVILFLKLRQNRSYGVFKSQNFVKTGKSFIVIEADTDRRIIYSVADPMTKEVRPFVHVLAETLETTPENLGNKLRGFTFGIEINDELYVRSVSKGHVERGGLSFFCDVNPGDKLELLKATDFVDQTKRDLDDFLKTRPRPLGAILNDCILRRVNNETQLGDLSGMWPMPVAGFSTFGELFGININQSLTAVVFFDTTGLIYTDRFFSDFPMHYARFLNYFENRFDMSRENLLGAKKRLEEEAAKNSAIMENVLEGIVTFDGDGSVHTFNKGAELEFGYNASEVVNKPVNGLMPTLWEEMKKSPQLCRLDASDTNFVDIDHEILGLRKNGEHFPLSIKVSHVVSGEKSLYVAVVRDVTVQKKREEAFRFAKESADLANRAKSEFLANMSHELRTPLNSILGMNRLLKETSLTKEQQELTEVISSSSINLLEIVNDILDLSKIESGEMKLERIGFDLKCVLDSVVNSLELFAQEKMIKLERHFGDVPLPYIIGDPTRFSSVLTNLVGNAIKYTDEGHVEIQASCKKIDGTHIDFFCEVIDTGIGISKDKQAKIFEKFVQADSSTTRKYGGTGLGLAITRQLVELMGGRIGVRSQVGVGSNFSFMIPFEIAEKLPEEKFVQGKNMPFKGVTLPENASVLIAEDHPTNQLLIKKLMQKFKVGKFEVVDNGLDVLEAYRRQYWDVILMDCHMPKKNGYDATEEIRQLEMATRIHVPIIAMTANAMVGDREKCLACGMDEYVSKPVNIDMLKEVMSRWIDFPEDNEKKAP